LSEKSTKVDLGLLNLVWNVECAGTFIVDSVVCHNYTQDVLQQLDVQIACKEVIDDMRKELIKHVSDPMSNLEQGWFASHEVNGIVRLGMFEIFLENESFTRGEGKIQIKSTR